MKKILLLLLLTTFIFSCSNDDDGLQDFETSFFTDPRDGQTYQIVKIGNQIWFAENLNYDDSNILSTCYNNQDANCFTYGRLYASEDSKIACPNGYHLPTREEWLELFDYLGGINVAHQFLKPNAEQLGRKTNFNLLAGGRRVMFDFFELGDIGYYWYDWEFTPSVMRFEPDVSVSFLNQTFLQSSCRCVKD